MSSKQTFHREQIVRTGYEKRIREILEKFSENLEVIKHYYSLEDMSKSRVCHSYPRELRACNSSFEE